MNSSGRSIEFYKLGKNNVILAEIRPVQCLIESNGEKVKSTKWMDFEHWQELETLVNNILCSYEERQVNYLYNTQSEEPMLLDGSQLKIGYSFIKNSNDRCSYLVPRHDAIWTDGEHSSAHDKGGRYKNLGRCEYRLVVAVSPLGVKLPYDKNVEESLFYALDTTAKKDPSISSYFQASSKLSLNKGNSKTRNSIGKCDTKLVYLGNTSIILETPNISIFDLSSDSSQIEGKPAGINSGNKFASCGDNSIRLKKQGEGICGNTEEQHNLRIDDPFNYSDNEEDSEILDYSSDTKVVRLNSRNEVISQLDDLNYVNYHSQNSSIFFSDDSQVVEQDVLIEGDGSNCRQSFVELEDSGSDWGSAKFSNNCLHQSPDEGSGLEKYLTTKVNKSVPNNMSGRENDSGSDERHKINLPIINITSPRYNTSFDKSIPSVSGLHNDTLRSPSNFKYKNPFKIKYSYHRFPYKINKPLISHSATNDEKQNAYVQTTTEEEDLQSRTENIQTEETISKKLPKFGGQKRILGCDKKRVKKHRNKSPRYPLRSKVAPDYTTPENVNNKQRNSTNMLQDWLKPHKKLQTVERVKKPKKTKLSIEFSHSIDSRPSTCSPISDIELTENVDPVNKSKTIKLLKYKADKSRTLRKRNLYSNSKCRVESDFKTKNRKKVTKGKHRAKTNTDTFMFSDLESPIKPSSNKNLKHDSTSTQKRKKNSKKPPHENSLPTWDQYWSSSESDNSGNVKKWRRKLSRESVNGDIISHSVTSASIIETLPISRHHSIDDLLSDTDDSPQKSVLDDTLHLPNLDDTPLTPGEIEEMNFREKVITYFQALSKEDCEQHYEDNLDYFLQLKSRKCYTKRSELYYTMQRTKINPHLYIMFMEQKTVMTIAGKWYDLFTESNSDAASFFYLVILPELVHKIFFQIPAVQNHTPLDGDELENILYNISIEIEEKQKAIGL